MKEFKQYVENGFVHHRLTSFFCWAPFPPGEEGSERFYEVFFDRWTRYVTNEPKTYELIPDTPKHCYVVLLGDAYAIAEERSMLNFHVAGYFPRTKSLFRMSDLHSCLTPARSFSTFWLNGLEDSGSAWVSAAIGRLNVSANFRDSRVFIAGKNFWWACSMHMCMECNRGIHYPTGLLLFRSSQPMDPTGVKQPPWLATALRQPGSDQARDIVADSEVERLRNSTIARSVIADHRIRGPMLGAIRF